MARRTAGGRLKDGGGSAEKKGQKKRSNRLEGVESRAHGDGSSLGTLHPRIECSHGG